MSLGQFKQGDEPHWLPLRIAVEGGHEDVCMYLLGLTGPAEDLSGSWCKGFTLMHFAAMSGNLPFLQALVQRGVEFDVRHDSGITPLEFAMIFCRLPVVHFLLEQYRLRGREKQDMLREVEDRLPVAASDERLSLLFRIIRQEKKNKFGIKDEDIRAMVAFLVREAGADIWAEGHMEYLTLPLVTSLPVRGSIFFSHCT